MSESDDRITHFYKQVDGTIKWPNSCEGDVLKICHKEKKELERKIELIEKLFERKIGHSDDEHYSAGLTVALRLIKTSREEIEKEWNNGSRT